MPNKTTYQATVQGFKRGDIVRVACAKGYAVGSISAVGLGEEDFTDFDELPDDEPMDEWGEPDSIVVGVIGSFTLSYGDDGWTRVDTEWGCDTKVEVSHADQA